jgi:hypothetical protein
MFKKLLAKVGIGAATVDMRLYDALLAPGEILNRDNLLFILRSVRSFPGNRQTSAALAVSWKKRLIWMNVTFAFR